jgi:hypothetical protein
MRHANVPTCLLIAGLFVGYPALAAVPSSTDEQTLERLSVEWMEAIEKKDRKSLEAFLADNYVLQMPGDSDSQYTRRNEWIKNAINMDWSDFRYENVMAQVHGDHATVSSRLYFRVAPFPFELDSGVVDTWERHDGRWQVTTRYLGESNMQQRITFIFGVLAAGLAAGAAYAVAALVRWSRRRRAA